MNYRYVQSKGRAGSMVHIIREIRECLGVYPHSWCERAFWQIGNKAPPALFETRPAGVPICRRCAEREHAARMRNGAPA